MKNFFAVTRFVVLSAALFVSLAAVAITKKPAPSICRGELLSKVKKTVMQIMKAAKSDRKSQLQDLQKLISENKTQARAALDKASDAHAAAAEQSRLDDCDTVAVDMDLAFERVFETLLAPEFETDTRFRERGCEKLPDGIRFDELALAPEGTPLSPEREQALSVVRSFCSGKR